MSKSKNVEPVVKSRMIQILDILRSSSCVVTYSVTGMRNMSVWLTVKADDGGKITSRGCQLDFEMNHITGVNVSTWDQKISSVFPQIYKDGCSVVKHKGQIIYVHNLSFSTDNDIIKVLRQNLVRIERVLQMQLVYKMLKPNTRSTVFTALVRRCMNESKCTAKFVILEDDRHENTTRYNIQMSWVNPDTDKTYAELVVQMCWRFRGGLSARLLGSNPASKQLTKWIEKHNDNFDLNGLSNWLEELVQEFVNTEEFITMHKNLFHNKQTSSYASCASCASCSSYPYWSTCEQYYYNMNYNFYAHGSYVSV